MDVKGIFSYNLKRLRNSKGYTQNHLAELVGVSDKYIGQLEQRTKFPSDKVIGKIAEALNCQLYELFLVDTSLIISDLAILTTGKKAEIMNDVKHALESSLLEISKSLDRKLN